MVFLDPLFDADLHAQAVAAVAPRLTAGGMVYVEAAAGARLRSIAETKREKGALFERLMRKYFTEDPLYRERFTNVWLWAEWPAHYPGFDRADTGIDLVAQERDGSGYCAIQCKCYAPGTTVGKPSCALAIWRSAPSTGPT